MLKLPAVIFHLLPVIPFAMGYNYVGIAAVLLVGLAYIKVQKLRVMIQEQMQKSGTVDKSIPPALEFWERLTFLPEKEAS